MLVMVIHRCVVETNRPIGRRNLIRVGVNLVSGRLGGRSLRMLLVPRCEGSTKSLQVHLESLLVRMVSVQPVLLGDESGDGKRVLEEDVGGSMTLLRSVVKEDVVGEVSDSSNQGTHGESVLPVVVVEVGVDGETIRGDLRREPVVKICAHSVNFNERRRESNDG